MGRCLAIGWAPVITGAGWGRGAVQGEVHVEELATHMERKGRQRHIHCLWQLASWLYSGQGKGSPSEYKHIRDLIILPRLVFLTSVADCGA